MLRGYLERAKTAMGHQEPEAELEKLRQEVLNTDHPFIRNVLMNP